MGSMIQANRRKLLGIAQIALSAVLLIWLLSRVGLSEVVATLATIDWRWYLLAFGLFQLNAAIRAYRWYVLLHSLDKRPSLFHLIYLYYVGFFANNFIPSGFGGDLVKVVSLRQSYGYGSQALSSVAMERLTGLVGSSLIALMALVWNLSSHTADLDLPSALWGIVVLISLGIPTLFFVARWSHPVDIANRLFPWVSSIPYYSKIENLVNTIHRYPLRALLGSLLISIPFTLSLVFIQMAIARAFGVQLPFAVFALFVPLIALINLLPIAFNGLGLREGAYAFLFVPIGVPAATALSMSLAFYFLRFSAGLIGGVMYALRNLLHVVESPPAENL